MSEQKRERFQILSLDGGGIKGLFSVALLAKLEEDHGCDITEHFDLIVGTSTGGIIALALGAGMRPREIVEFYLSNGQEIFHNLFGLSSAKHWFCRKFSQKSLRKALQKCFGDKRLADSKKRLVITSYNLGEDDIYLFKTPHHERLRRDYKIPMWKVALATSAAPTYFPIFTGLDSIRLIDGGVWANNPTMVGIIEAMSLLEVPSRLISVFNVGTSDVVSKHRKWLNWGGKLVWAKSALAVNLIMRGQNLGVHKQAVHLLGDDRVRRLDPKVPDGLLSMDRMTPNELLSKAAHESRNFSPEFKKVFMPHIAPSYEPTYK